MSIETKLVKVLQENKYLRKENEGLKKELVLIKKYYRLPTHGICCTCQRCGQSYDDCKCTLYETATELEKALKRIEELEKENKRYVRLIEQGE